MATVCRYPLSQGEDGALRIASTYLPPGHIEHSADAARIEADGRFELLGRLDRIVKLEEKRISLPMLEQALVAHDWVLEARLGVAGKPGFARRLAGPERQRPVCLA